MYSGAALKSMLGDVAPGSLEAELVATDRILQRWAVSIGTGLPTERWDDRPISKPLPLDDDTAIVVDQIILKCPPRTRRIVKAWYRTPAPVHIIAEEMRMSRRGLYTAWRLSLNFLKLKFEMANHPPLQNLLHVRTMETVKLEEP